MEIIEKTNLSPAHWFTTLLLFCCLGTNLQAFDLEREKRLEEQTLAALFTGEPLYLSAAEHEFLALETQAEGESKGAVILLHGRGYSPDSQIVVGPVREALSEQGWHSLSLQMPVLEKGAKYYDYINVFPDARLRISAALAHLQASNISPVVIIAHSCGVHMSMDWIRHNGDDAIDAYVGLGMGATDYQQPMKQPFPFKKMTVPILDVFGDADYPAVVTKADERAQDILLTNDKSEQIIIAQADHEFEDQNEQLIESISNWLDTL